jgi:RNA polymerase sigma factor (sigma-70 family)
LPTGMKRVPHSEDFDEFFRAEFTLLVAFLRRLGHGLEASKDAAAEAMVCALHSWNRLTTPQAWVRIAARRIALRELRRQRRLTDRAVSTGLVTSDPSPDPSDVVTGRLRVAALLATLPSQQREVISWYLDGFQTCEIAELLGISEANVRSTKRHARKLLQKRLDDELRRRPGEEERGYGA